jgi:RNA polymerase sigma-70 factor (ECF subfamily)
MMMDSVCATRRFDTDGQLFVPRPVVRASGPTLRFVDIDAEWLDSLLAGDEDAFVMLVTRYRQPMLRVAESMLLNRAVAEEVVQDTWVGVVRGIDRFEGRSSLKTWLFSILVNRARSAGAHEPSGPPIDTLHAVDPLRFDADGHWADPLDSWAEESDNRLDAGALLPVLQSALRDLPPRQRQIVLLRDVEGLTHDEACAVLGISAGNQRLLLHRGRARLREILEAAMDKG